MSNMSFGTRAQLLDAVTRELDRDDLVEEIPGFLVLAQGDINADTQPKSDAVHTMLTCNADYQSLPSDFQTPIALTITNLPGQTEIAYATPARIAYLRGRVLSGVPANYTIIGTQIWFDRTPSNVVIDLAYYNGLTALVADGDTNSLLLNFPALYFYATLLHSAPFLKDDARIALWSKLYQDNVTRITMQFERARRGASPLNVRPRRHLP